MSDYSLFICCSLLSVSLPHMVINEWMCARALVYMWLCLRSLVVWCVGMLGLPSTAFEFCLFVLNVVWLVCLCIVCCTRQCAASIGYRTVSIWFPQYLLCVFILIVYFSTRARPCVSTLVYEYSMCMCISKRWKEMKFSSFSSASSIFSIYWSSLRLAVVVVVKTVLH